MIFRCYEVQGLQRFAEQPSDLVLKL